MIVSASLDISQYFLLIYIVYLKCLRTSFPNCGVWLPEMATGLHPVVHDLMLKNCTSKCKILECIIKVMKL